jgi:AcrR family transcriptional regulator
MVSILSRKYVQSVHISTTLGPAKPSAAAKRSYLSSHERRRHLLDAAARLFDRGGFGGITMVGLAAEAAVSRQLVYDHFADVAGLLTAFVEDRLARYSAHEPTVDSTRGLESIVVTKFRHLLTIPASDRRIIRLVVADAAMPELDGARQLLLDHEWRHTRVPKRRARPTRRDTALVLSTMSALLSLADAVSNRQLSAADAETLAVRIVVSLHQAD